MDKIPDEYNYDEAVIGSWLISMITTHIDDIKGSATEPEQVILLKVLQRDYGSDANIEKISFEHTGINMSRTDRTLPSTPTIITM